MRNLKKFLALVLAMMMVFSMMVTVSAKDVSKYGDVDKDEEFYEAIAVLSGMNVLEGDDSGFRPDEYISRAEMAAVLYRIYTGNVGESGKQNAALFADYEDTFTDVKGTGSDWALGYINFDRANGLVKGDPDGMYRPADNVTGYEALAMILRAVGYGKQGEFEGGGYQYQVAYRGSLLGITDNITDGTLGQKATRAMVAEMAFRAVVPGVPQADWAELVGYYTTESVMSDKQRPSLGEEHFGLTNGDLYVNQWGRPSNRWWKAGTKTVYANLMYEPVATFGNIKDECDVIDEFGIKEDDIVTYYVDNVLTSPSNATSAGKSKIREQGVGSTMGGMGTLTEIYKKSNGDYWIVEINTYLALVTDVHEPEADKHDHIGDRTVDLKLFIDASSSTVDTGVVWKGYETDDYAEGNYIRVNLDLADSAHAKIATQSNCDVYDLGIAEALVIGDYKENFAAYYPDPARTVVAVSTLKDETKADSKKFYLNAHEDGTWVFLNDGYGNILGQTVANFKYGVIGAIVWINNGLNPGHAEAKIYPVNELNTRADDGYIIKTVTNLNGAAAKNAEGNPDSINQAPDWNGILDSVANNTKLVGHLVVYSENDDETIDIVTHAYDAANNNVYFGDRVTTRIVDGTPGDMDSPYTVNNGQSNVLNKGKAVMSKANDYTVYLIENDDGGFDRHVGMRNVPTTTGTGVCILEGENGYASLVVLTKTKDDTTRTFVAFVGNSAVATEGNATAKRTNRATSIASEEIYYAHDVYELGTYTGAATKVYDLATNGGTASSATTDNIGYKWDATIANAGPGLYEFTVDSDNVIESMRLLVQLAVPTTNENNATSDTINNYWYANFATRVKAVGNAMITATYTSIVSGEASPISTTANDIGFNIYDATIIKLTQKKAAASEGTVSTSDIFTVGQWNKSDAIPANAAVLVVYERAASANRNNWTAYVYVLAEPEMATTDEIDDTTTPPDCISVYTRLNDPTKEITSNDRIKIIATGTITVAEGEKAIEAYLKAAGYSIKDMTVTIASNGEHTYTIMSTGGETTYQTTFYWNPDEDVVTEGAIVKVGDKSFVVPEDFPYASVGQLLGKTATADLGTYVKVTTTGGTGYFDKDIGASNGDTIEFAYFKVTVKTAVTTGGSITDGKINATKGTLATAGDTTTGALYVKKGDKVKVEASVGTASSIASDAVLVFIASEDGIEVASDHSIVIATDVLTSNGDITKPWTYEFKGKGDLGIEVKLYVKEDFST